MSQGIENPNPATLGQQVLVLQGGGALGAYQVGVYQALDQFGIDLDWVVGTSIGAINAAIIAGSPRSERMQRLRAFWKRVEHGHVFDDILPSLLSSPLRNWLAVSTGIAGFFKPRALAFLSPHLTLGPGEAGYYSVTRLKDTLSDLIEFDLLRTGSTRLTVGAANVETSEMTYFDSRAMALDIRHVLASGALPPAFPAVEIDGHHYWDGGIFSNTPVEVVFDDNPRRNSIVYAVHVWNPEGAAPQTMSEVENRRKDVQYSSRSAAHIARQRQLHRLRHVITQLADLLPVENRTDPKIRDLASYGCRTRMHVVRLLAPRLGHEDYSKDLDFSPSGIRQRWEAGYAHTMRVLESAPWRGEFDPLEGFVLHEAMGGESRGAELILSPTAL
ncbi:MAG TPA: patatin-like phospholipase family protein [Casimicrobiaceae bacterium]|nr:patatin-like phospholipase family protein [Casimicrobiaceae bacterium]